MAKLWKRIPLWLKCGVITDLFLINIYLFGFNVFNAVGEEPGVLGTPSAFLYPYIWPIFPIALFATLFPARFLPSSLSDLFFEYDGFWGPSPNITAVYYSLLFWFIVASVIGLLIEKIRARKEPESEAYPKRTKVEVSAEQKELTPEEFYHFSKVTIETITGREFFGELECDEAKLKEAMEQAVIESVKGLPEELAEKLGTVDPAPLNERATQLLAEIQQETDPRKLAKLQIELIFQYITLTSRVQNGGDKGFIPSVAREVDGLDCSLSAWVLKEKLERVDKPNVKFEFGYPSDHAVGIVFVADGRRLYVDAQNGFVFEIEVQQVQDEDSPDTAYPIYEITKSNRLTGAIPSEGEVTLTRPKGSDYLPKYLGIQEKGLLHSVGNLHMLVNKESPTYNTKVASKFRDALNNDPTKWQRFQKFVDKIAGGKVIQQTKFEKQSQKHREEYEIQKVRDKIKE